MNRCKIKLSKVTGLLQTEFFRFLVVGGFNSLLGYAVTMLFFSVFHIDYRVSQILNFAVCFPIAYSLQAVYAFRTKWSLKRLLIYPVTSLPNWILQFITLLLFVELLNVPEYISYLIANVVPIPVMFFVVKFVVKPKEKEVKEKKNKKPFSINKNFIYAISLYTLFFVIIFALGYREFLVEHGKSFIWTPDGKTQHFPFLYDLAELMKGYLSNPSNGIPQWSWEIGFGADILQSYTYYVLGDPLSVLAGILLPLKYMEIGYNVLIVIRLYLVGVSFIAYSQYMKLRVYPCVVGSLLYTFSGFMIFWGIRHPYFLNPAILLPILFISIEELLKNKKPYLFILCVAFSAINSFYFLYMNTIAIFIYAIVRFFAYDSENRWALFGKLFIKTMLCYILGIMIGAFVFLPSVYGYLHTIRVMNYDLKFELGSFGHYYNLTRRIISIGIGKVSVITVSAIALPSAFLLFSMKMSKIRTFKVLFIIFALFLYIPFMYSVFNGFNAPAARWVYMLGLLSSFVVSLILNYREEISKGNIYFALCGSFIYFIIFFRIGDYSFTRGVVLPLLCTVVFLLLLLLEKYEGRFAYFKRTVSFKYYFAIIILLLVTLNLSSNIKVLMLQKNYGNQFLEWNSLLYSYEQDKTSLFHDVINDNSFYRIDYKDSRNNKSVINNFKGVGVYDSIINENVSNLFFDNNIRTTTHRAGFTGIDDITILESLLGVKYYLTDEDDEILPYGFELYEKKEKYNIYENKAVLPLGFVYYNTIDKNSISTANDIDRIQVMLHGAVVEEDIEGIQGISPNNISEKVPYEIEQLKDVSMKGNSIYVEKNDGKITLKLPKLTNSELTLMIKNLHHENKEIEFSIQTSYHNTKKSEKVASVNNQFYIPNEDFLINLGYSDIHEDLLNITFPVKGEYTFDSLELYQVPVEDYDRDIAKLKESAIQDVTLVNNELNGHVTLDKKGVLFLSIPYSNGWNCYVDGKKADAIKVNTSFTGIVLDKGSHDIYMKYTTPLLLPSIGISIMGILLLFIVIFRDRKKGK